MSWKSAGLPIPYRQETLDITIMSLRPDSREEEAESRSFSISSFMLRSFSIYVSVVGR